MMSIGIQKRLVASFLLISLIPLLSIGTLSYLKSGQAVKDKIGLYSGEISNQVKSNMVLTLDNLENKVDEFVLDTNIQKQLTTFIDNESEESRWALQDALSQRYLVSDEVSFAYIQTVKGTIHYGNTVSDELAKEYLSSAKSWTPARIDDRKIVILKKAIKSMATGDTLGTFLLGVNEDGLAKAYKNLNVGENASKFIFSEDYITVSSLNPNKDIGADSIKGIVDGVWPRFV